jgi:hypothetical protein
MPEPSHSARPDATYLVAGLVRFRSFEVALESQKLVCTRGWAHWLYERLGLAYRRDAEPLPDDWNARAGFSALHHEEDRFGRRGAAAGDVLVWAIWEGCRLNDLRIIRDRRAYGVTDLREQVGRSWVGYRCKRLLD